VSNAIKFTNQGTVDISCNVLQDFENQQILEVKVHDTGVGMDEKFIAQLFDKFSQEDNSVTRKFGGTGLGMSICKELVELMGGAINVSSKKNKGTTISVVLKMLKGTQNDLPEKENLIVDTKLLKHKHILVTDDNDINRLLALTILENFGAHITEAKNGLEAVELTKTNNFDLVLMDVQMPIMDGLEATKLIRKSIDKKLPIIALTAFALKGDNQKCFDAGMNDYLSKPFEEKQLLEIVSKWFGKPNSSVTQSEQKIIKVTPLFNLSQIEDIARGNQQFILKMIGLFLELIPISIKEMKEAYKNADYVKIANVAHRIKPSIDNMGIISLKDKIKEIELFAVQYGKSDKLEDLLKKVDSVMNEVMNQLKDQYL
jgi:CheY-like chemotaxis protein/HPt (histidine-containing phosphotransfer) domain-containing protein